MRAGTPTRPVIALVNRSKLWTDKQLETLVKPYQVQVSRDLLPRWGLDAEVAFISSPPPKAAWVIGFFDTLEEAGALGYHDRTKNGLPLGKVGIKTTIDAGGIVSVTGSHELLEMIVDPWIEDVVFVEDEQRLYAKEVCDACEADNLAYVIDGVKVSDFVTPTWFRKESQGPYDFLGKIKKPFALLPGGYIGVFDILKGQWSQVVKDKKAVTYKQRPHVGSRRERRKTPRSAWLNSTE